METTGIPFYGDFSRPKCTPARLVIVTTAVFRCLLSVSPIKACCFTYLRARDARESKCVVVRSGVAVAVLVGGGVGVFAAAVVVVVVVGLVVLIVAAAVGGGPFIVHAVVDAVRGIAVVDVTAFTSYSYCISTPRHPVRVDIVIRCCFHYSVDGIRVF